MNKTLNGSVFQSPYYDYLYAMVAAAPSIRFQDDMSLHYFNPP